MMSDTQIKFDRFDCGYVYIDKKLARHRNGKTKKGCAVGTIPWSWKNCDLNLDYDKDKNLIGIEVLLVKRMKKRQRSGK